MHRRSFLTSLSALAASPFAPRLSAAEPATVLDLQTRTIEVNGKAATVLGITQPNGTSGVVTDVAQPFRVRVRNHLDRASLIHWHGLTPPFQQDGVPYISAPPIPAGGVQDYDFRLDFPGTFWMHSHVGFQEQQLLSAPLIIRDAGTRSAAVQEIVVMLHDFTFRDPREVFASLRQANRKQTASAPPAMAGMQTMKPDLNDVDYDAFLANDRTLADPGVIRVEPGGRIRLRLINGSAATNYWIDLGGLRGTLVAVDGSPVRPVALRGLPLAVAQRADILIELPREQGAHAILAQVEGKTDRTGVVLATARANVARIEGNATQPSRAFDFTFEQALRAAKPLAPHPAGIVPDILLSGDMQAYVWMMDNQVYPKITPVMVSAGKRVELVMRNKTMMSHPMHLHGHRFQVIGFDQQRFPGAVRDTVLVPPLRTVTVAFDADNPGRWAFHCHNLWHLAAGMMSVVDYAGVPMPLLPAEVD
ncbi:MAG: multicopper oxidase family protein [Acetobacteraceae bacterium]|jgi:FtsP/CotA-like multicopper oxidase with cupredoxin domain